MILYFSATGNTRYAAQKLGQGLEFETRDLFGDIRRRNKGTYESEDPFIILAPTYAWRMPRILEDHLRRSSFQGSREVYFILTCGDSMGAAALYNRKLAQDLDLDYRGSAQLVMPENYIMLFGAPDQEEEDRIMELADGRLDSLAAIIGSGQDLPEARPRFYERIMSGPINPLFYSLVVKTRKFQAGPACISCGLCRDLCPLASIEILDGRPSWSRACSHCSACINYCPVQAIEYGSRTRGKRRYRARIYQA